MKVSTLEWVEKAESDWDMAQRAYRARKRPSNEAGIVPQKTHNLSDLLDDLIPTEPAWATLRPLLIGLTKYAVLYRYPKFNATKAETQTAIKNCREVRRVIRTAFGLPV